MEERKCEGQSSKKLWNDSEVIHFIDVDLGELVLSHEDAFVITLRVDKYDITCVRSDV